VAISPYIQKLRGAVGRGLLLLPSVTALVFDDRGRVPVVLAWRLMLPGHGTRPGLPLAGHLTAIFGRKWLAGRRCQYVPLTVNMCH
jgi:hypothetical protein